VVVSLVVSVLVIPSFAAVLLRKRKARAREEDEEVRGVAAAMGRLIRLLVGGVVRAPLLSAGVLVFVGWLGISSIPPMEYLPTGNRDVVFGAVIPPPGYSVDEIEAIGRSIQGQLVPHIHKEIDGQPALDRMFFFGGPDSAFMGAVGENTDRMPEVVAMLRKAQLTVPGAFSFASQAALFGRRLGGGRAVEIDLLSADLVGTIQFAQKLMGAISAAMPGAQVRPIPGLDYGAAEFRVRPDRVQASAVGLSPVDIGQVVDAYVDGAIIGELGVVGQPKRDVLLRAMGVRLDDPEQLITAPVPTPGGRFVPLGELASVLEYLGPTILQHIERRRALTLQVTPPDSIALETAVNLLRDDIVNPMLQEAGAPPDLSAEFSGTAGQLEAAQGRLGMALLLAVLISYLLLSALFENFLAPLAIMISVPMAGTGGVLGLKLVNITLTPQPLDMMTALGFIILIGVVVNNAILVVDGALSRLRNGLDLVTATADAVQRRLRPIAMTTLTSLAGLLPLVIMPGAGSELYRGVGAVVLGGLALGTVLTVFLVPTVFVTLWRLRGLFTKKALAAPA
jgi:HAE1 family hydrophobic/amphiphilic exporter-1